MKPYRTWIFHSVALGDFSRECDTNVLTVSDAHCSRTANRAWIPAFPPGRTSSGLAPALSGHGFGLETP